MKQLFSNNAVSLISSPIDSTQTSITIIAGHGQLFPTPQANEFFAVTLEDQAATVREIVHVTSRSGDTFTVLRGQEGTTARAWTASEGSDTLFDHRITADTLARLANDYSNSSFPAITNYDEAIDYLLESGGSSGASVIDANIIVAIQGPETVVTVPSAYKPASTAVYVGGARQKRGVDFIEVAPNKIHLQYVLTQAQIDAGQNVVVDYVVA